jgi:hypothetical protein
MDDEIITVSWIETRQFSGGPMRTEVWLRADPPAMSRRTPGLAGQHRLVDGHGDQTTSDTSPYVQVADQRFPFTAGSVQRAGLAPGATGWDRTDFEENGQRLARYERRSVRHNFEVEELIIADAGTHRIVRQTERQYELQGHQLVSETVRDQYAFNAVAPSGTFDMPTDKERRPQTVDEH